MYLNIDVSRKKDDEDVNKNIYSTTIPCHNVSEAIDEDWQRYKYVIENHEWKDSVDVQERVNKFTEVY